MLRQRRAENCFGPSFDSRSLFAVHGEPLEPVLKIIYQVIATHLIRQIRERDKVGLLLLSGITGRRVEGIVFFGLRAILSMPKSVV